MECIGILFGTTGFEFLELRVFGYIVVCHYYGPFSNFNSVIEKLRNARLIIGYLFVAKVLPIFKG